ncbi:ATP-binding protein [Vibrio astriarenae]|uniref:ATP-binding protein n=1 Tax=Vibrio astriarenae TaxID=1481923 RepID=UPI003734E325
MNKFYLSIGALLATMIVTLSLLWLHYVEHKSISHYRELVSHLGHDIVEIRDEITLSSINGLDAPYQLNRQLVSIEREVHQIEKLYKDNKLEGVFFHQLDINNALTDFHDSALEVTDALDHIVGVIVARNSVLSSIQAKTVQGSSNEASKGVAVEHILASFDSSSFVSQDLERLSLTFSGLVEQEKLLFSIVLSGTNVGFVEHAEHTLTDLTTVVRDRVAALLFASILLVFSILGLMGWHRAKELKRNSIAYQESVEKAEQASNSKSLFLATMSHELRTPMNGVLGVAQLIKEQTTELETKKNVQTIINSGEHLVTLLNDLLDFSKMEQDKLKLEAVPFGVSNVVDSIESALKPLALNKQIDLNIVNQVPENVELIGDAARLRQILFNLIGNGIKFTEHGQVDLNIQYVMHQKHNLEIKVTDTGVGIERDKLDRIFNAFEQAELSTTRKFGGTGLGLSIVKQLVDLMGGSVEVFSQPDVGTEFTIKLSMPVQILKLELEFEDLDTGKEAPVKPDSSTGLHVLVVEDNNVSALFFKSFCETEGYQVTHVYDGSEAIDFLKGNHVDLIVMDNHMPKMNGVEAIRQIRQGLKLKTCIFACTGDVFKEAHDEFIAAGANFVLTKPLQLDSLRRAIARHSSVIMGDYPKESNVVSLTRSPIESLPLTEEEISTSELLNGDTLEEEMKTDLLKTFVEEIEQNVEKLIEAYRSESTDSLFNVLHSTKGITAEFGLSDVSHRAEKCEVVSRGGSIPPMEELQLLVNLLLVNIHQAERILERNVAVEAQKESL